MGPASTASQLHFDSNTESNDDTVGVVNQAYRPITRIQDSPQTPAWTAPSSLRPVCQGMHALHILDPPKLKRLRRSPGYYAGLKPGSEMHGLS